MTRQPPQMIQTQSSSNGNDPKLTSSISTATRSFYLGLARRITGFESQINLSNKIYQPMQELPFHKQRQASVSFTYGTSPLQPSRSLDKSQEPQPKQISKISLRSRKNINIEIKPPQSSNIQEASQVRTLKKQAGQLEAESTTRKSYVLRTETEQAHSQMLDYSRVNSTRMNEAQLLKEEIKFMRNKLSEAENAYKDVQLQFQLYRARVEMVEGSSEKIISIEKLSDAGVSAKDMENQQVGTLELREKLSHEQLKSADLQKQLQQLRAHLQSLQSSHQSQLRCKDAEICQLVQSLQQKQQQILKSELEADSLREQTTASAFRFINESNKLELANQRLHSQLNEEKATRNVMEYRLQEAEDQLQDSNNKVNELTQQLEQRMKDIDFLNQQSYTLDLALNDAYRQIDALRNQLAQNSQDHSHHEVEALREKSSRLQQSVFSWEGQIERLALEVYQLRGKYEQSLQQITQEVNTVDQLKAKLQELQAENYRLETLQNEEQRRNVRATSHLQGQLARLRGQNLHLRAAVDKLESNQRVLLNELEWLRKQRDEILSSQQNNKQQYEKHYQSQINRLKRQAEENRLNEIEQIKQLQTKLNQMTTRYSELTEHYEENLNSVIQDYQARLHREQHLEASSKQIEVGSSRSIETGLKGQTLSKQELNQYIQNIKMQPQSGEEEQMALRQEVEALQEEMQFIKMTYDQSIRDMKAKYQREIIANKQEFDSQLNAYRQEIESLRQEMAHLKGEYVLNQVEVIEEEPEEDEDEGELEQKVRRDLMMHVEDPSDFYISPPSNTPIKAVSSPSDPRKEAEGGFMLKDIMDLQTKIHSYIKNFNKKRSKDMDDPQ